MNQFSPAIASAAPVVMTPRHVSEYVCSIRCGND
jgi:hypothetical protein